MGTALKELSVGSYNTDFTFLNSTRIRLDFEVSCGSFPSRIRCIWDWGQTAQSWPGTQLQLDSVDNAVEGL